MLARLKWSRCLLLLPFVALGGCARQMPAALPVGTVMSSEETATLYKMRPIRLATLASDRDRTAFLDDLADAAMEAGHGGVTIRIEALPADFLRVERRENQLPIAVHFLIVENEVRAGSVIRLQPLTAWRPAFGGGGGTELLARDIAASTVDALRKELPALAETLP